MNAKKESKKKRKLEKEANEAEAGSAKAEKVKKKRSDAAAVTAGEEQPPKKKSKKDKASGKPDAEQPADNEPVAAADPNALDNFKLSEGIKSLLRSKGIEALFPIQSAAFNLVVEGTDVVGRARTGCGKTLAFVLPIVQSLANQASTGRAGRLPSVIVLAPTRELAKQVSSQQRATHVHLVKAAGPC